MLFGLVGGWLLAGVVLRPLDRITDAARRARDGDLDHRIALPGLRDELTDLADTFDAMLDRVEHTIDEERRFAANASHELRTPHAIIRTMVEVAQADPDGRDVDILLAADRQHQRPCDRDHRVASDAGPGRTRRRARDVAGRPRGAGRRSRSTSARRMPRPAASVSTRLSSPRSSTATARCSVSSSATSSTTRSCTTSPGGGCESPSARAPARQSSSPKTAARCSTRRLRSR